ncbi:MAG TPA: formate dehydrogenase accessory sulfurtransferase FdhD [Gemmatimonadales bacterium]|jgi:FdhD protein|nr:formate dehydrogenase accessory sulfurtransferase FdhD [Gemmatimonadales bacterium]
MTDDVAQMEDPLGLRRLGYVRPLLELRAQRWEAGKLSERVETVAEETPVTIVYNGIPHVVMMATPQDLEDFALGFSITEELIGSPADLHKVECIRYSQGIEIQATVSSACAEVIATRTRRLTGRTGCGICGADSVAAVLKELHPVNGTGSIREVALQAALESLTSHQALNAAAGAVHAAAWAVLDGSIQLVREDVGRHNALDKLIGALLRQGTDPGSGFVVVTSRASFEMVQKTTVLGAPLMAAVSGPTGLAIRIAQQAGLTLVGFARGDRHTVYTHPHRLTS